MTDGIRYASFTELPMKYPSRMTPNVQMAEPITLKTANVRASISLTPATGLAKVRTTGMNLASTTVTFPNRSKYPSARSTYSGLNSFDLGRLNSAGPALAPIRYPTSAPMAAAAKSR
jgi:hypothetical protein